MSVLGLIPEEAGRIRHLQPEPEGRGLVLLAGADPVAGIGKLCDDGKLPALFYLDVDFAL